MVIINDLAAGSILQTEAASHSVLAVRVDDSQMRGSECHRD